MLLLQRAESCEEINEMEADSGVYLINPGRGGRFEVHCNFSGGEATTLIGHNAEAETHVPCDPRDCHKRDITYQATDEQIRALITISATCRQYIKYRCRGSALVYDDSNPFAYWVSARGTKKYNWDGSVADKYCACSRTGTCLEPANSITPPRCNCDHNRSDTWTSDEGYLTSKDDLPVKALSFRDSGSDGEEGWYTLGKLECSGRA